MKKIIHISGLALLTSVFLLGSVLQSQAHPNGYWDRDGHWHNYEYYQHHQGYWDQRNGNRIWISIGI